MRLASTLAHTEHLVAHTNGMGALLSLLLLYGYSVCYAPFNKLALNTLSEHLTQLRSAYGIFFSLSLSVSHCNWLLVFVRSTHTRLAVDDQELHTQKHRPFL